jgi:hypothetical protein
VERLAACLDRLPDTPGQVLRLRAGLGSEAAQSRRAVAHRLDIGVRRVARAERRGVRRLRALARSSGCGGSTAAAAGGEESAAGGAGTSPGESGGGAAATGDGESAAGGKAVGAAQAGVKGVSRSSADDERSNSLPEPLGTVAGVGISPVLLLVALGLLIFAIRQDRRAARLRRRHV